MAVTITTVLAGADTYIADIETATETTTGNIPHGLGAIPLEVYITLKAPQAASVPAWAVSTINATNIVCTRDTTGAAASAFRLIVKKPHSIGR